MGRNGAGKRPNAGNHGILPQRSAKSALRTNEAMAVLQTRATASATYPGPRHLPLPHGDGYTSSALNRSRALRRQADEVLTAFPVLKQMAGARPACSGGQQQQLAIAGHSWATRSPAAGRAGGGHPAQHRAGNRGVYRRPARKMSVPWSSTSILALGVADHCYVMESGVWLSMVRRRRSTSAVAAIPGRLNSRRNAVTKKHTVTRRCVLRCISYEGIDGVYALRAP